MVPEAALQAEAPIKDAGYSYFMNNASFQKYCTGGLNSGDFWGIGNAEKALGMGEECRKRVKENEVFWAKWYLGSVDKDVYSEEDFKNKISLINFRGILLFTKRVTAN